MHSRAVSSAYDQARLPGVLNGILKDAMAFESPSSGSKKTPPNKLYSQVFKSLESGSREEKKEPRYQDNTHYLHRLYTKSGDFKLPERY